MTTKSIVETVIIGAKVVDVRPMTKAEMKKEFWDGEPPTAIVLDTGVVLYASQDEEGNGPGSMFGYHKKTQFGV